MCSSLLGIGGQAAHADNGPRIVWMEDNITVPEPAPGKQVVVGLKVKTGGTLTDSSVWYRTAKSVPQAGEPTPSTWTRSCPGATATGRAVGDVVTIVGDTVQESKEETIRFYFENAKGFISPESGLAGTITVVDDDVPTPA